MGPRIVLHYLPIWLPLTPSTSLDLQGHLITLFSATNYCGTANNAGAILVLGRDFVMVPKLIHPLPPTTPASGSRCCPSQHLQTRSNFCHSLGSILQRSSSLVCWAGVICDLRNRRKMYGRFYGFGPACAGKSHLISLLCCSADAWMQSVNDERPPTPPRGRPSANSASLAFFE